MSSERLIAINTDELSLRFDYLTGRFFDAVLSEPEDQELAALLSQNPALARRFIDQARIERAIIGMSNAERFSDDAFNAAVQRSVELLENEGEGERFATEVVSLVRARTSVRSRPRMRTRRVAALHSGRAATPMHTALIAASAAVLMLAVLIGLSGRSQPRLNSAPENLQVYHVDLGPKLIPDSEPDPETPLPSRIAENASTPVPAQENVALTPVSQIAKDAMPAPSVAAQAVPSTNKTVVATLPGQSATNVAIASVGRLNGVKVLRQRGDSAETATRSGEVCFEADRLHVVGADVSPGELPSGPLGAEVFLKDGGRLCLSLGAVLSLHMENDASRPVLESGNLLAHIKPQPEQSKLIIRTKYGVDTAVIGTVFQLSTDPSARRVTLKVDEGRVQFSSNGEKRLVTADEACSAEEGKSPLNPWQYRAHPASLTGTLVDKETGKPLADALVAVIPIADRMHPSRWGAKTDANGKFTINSIPEGPAFIMANTSEGGSVGLNGRGSITRAKFVSGDKLTANLTLDKASLAAIRINENGKPVSDCAVRLVPQGGDGQSLDVKITSSTKLAPGDYRAAAFEGSGRYSAIIEKKGFVARVRGANIFELRPDRVTNWPIDVQFAPSATLKGRVLNNSTGAPLTDEIDLNDPRQPRTTLTLLTPSGYMQSLLAEPDGSFTFDTNLDSGTYDLKVERFGFAPYIKRIILAAGQKLELSVPLDPAKPSRK